MRAFFAVFATAYAADPLFSCSQGPATLTVSTNFTYAISVGGSPWLSGGAVLVHASQMWFSSQLPASNLCSPLQSVDCVGNDLVNRTGVASASECCSLCSALPGCTAWSLEQPPQHCFLKNGCSNPTPVPNVVSGVSAAGLAAVASRPVEGFDDAGAFTGLEVTWSAGSAAHLATTFLCYADLGAIAFKTAWPFGAEGTNVTDAERAPGAWAAPIAHFPSFALAPGGWLAGDARWLHVEGIWTLSEVWGSGLASSGLNTDSPLWLYNASAPAQGTLLLAALDSALAQRVGVFADPAQPSAAPPRLSAGIYSTVTSVPPGFASRYAVFPSASGVSAAALEWGAAWQRVYDTQRIPTARDVLNRKLSYFSDNGATLFQSYWDTHCPTRNCSAVAVPNGTNAEATFLALKASHVADGIPAALYQLDTWWFTQWADRQPGGSLDCAEWAPREDLWPHGLPFVTQHDIPLLLYSWGWVTPEHGNTMTNFTWVPSKDGREAMVALDELYDFYSMIRDRFLTFNGTSYETDNTDSFTSQWAQSQVAVDSASRVWAGFATPWCEAGIPVQTCESKAGHLLESLKYGCITSQRDNIDDVPGNHGNPLTPDGNAAYFLHRWRVGHGRLLMAALAQRPFFDNVWTTQWQNASTWAGNAEYYVELAWALSVLTAGAVGFGDFPGNSNRSLIMTGVRSDGVLLSPSLPSYYADFVYAPAGSPASLPNFDPRAARVFQAPSFPAASQAGAAAAAAAAAARGNYDLGYFSDPRTPWAPPFLTLLAVDVNSSVALLPGALTPDLTPAVVSARAGLPAGGVAGYVAVPWSRGFAATAAACADGAPAGGCAAPFSPNQPLPLFTGAPQSNNTHAFELWSLAPVYANGFALLGELEKVVRVAEARVPWVAPSGAQLLFQLLGAPGESVRVAVLCPPAAPGASGAARAGALGDGVVRLVARTLPASGVLNVSCTAAACE